MTLIGARLLGAQVATAHDAAPARWFDERRKESVWREISAGPARRGSFAEAAPARVSRRVEQNREQLVGAAEAPEETSMKSQGIGKFLELGSVVQGSERSQRWFSLPGSWRAPRVQIMRHREQAGSAERDERRTLRMLTPAGERGGF